MTDIFPEPHMDSLARAMVEDGIVRPFGPSYFGRLEQTPSAHLFRMGAAGSNKPLLSLNFDGTVEANLDEMDETVRVFLASLRSQWAVMANREPLQEAIGHLRECVKLVPEPGAVEAAERFLAEHS